jgi:hypothetical protein
MGRLLRGLGKGDAASVLTYRFIILERPTFFDSTTRVLQTAMGAADEPPGQ